MSLRVVVKNSLPASVSPYRLLDDRGREVTWVNQFLDAQRLRQLSLRSLRAYAYDLLHVARWFQDTRHSLGRLNQYLLLDYVRDQLEQPAHPLRKPSITACACCAACIVSITDKRFPASRTFSAVIPRALPSAMAVGNQRSLPAATAPAAPCDRAPFR